MSKMNNKEEEKESFKEYISRILGNAFVDNLPFQAIAELPKIYMYTFGMICQILILLCFVYFIVLVYRQGVEQKFMSLSTDSGDCNSIIKYVSGDYTADENGIWVGSDGYDYSRAIYEMDLVDSALTVEDYQQLMLNADNQLDFMGRQSKDFDLSFNLIIYISWQMTCTQDTDYCHRFEGQAFALTADAAYMFHVSHQSGTYSSITGDCNYTLATFDLANAEQTISMSYNDFIDNPVCAAVGHPSRLGYDDVLDGDEFNFILDVRTFADAFAASSTVLFLTDLHTVSDVPTINVTVNGYLYIGNYYIDTYYAGMEPMFCIWNTNGTGDGNNPHPGSLNQLCFLQQGDTMGLPLFMHYGSWSADEAMTPRPCWCDAYGHDDYCSEVDLISGFLFYDTNLDMTGQIQMLLGTIVKSPGYYAFNKMAYNATWASAASTYSSTDPMYKDPVFRKDAYDFCFSEFLNESCSILSINVYGDSLFDKALTEFMYILTEGSCNDVFTMSDNTLQGLLAKPPTPFVENYYECTLSEVDAFINAVGIASGNTGTLVPVAILCLLPLLYMWLNATGQTSPKEEYSREDKALASEFIAIQVLRARDGKTRGMTKKSVIKDLAAALLYAATTDAGYPDSDDSDDEEDQDLDSNPFPTHTTTLRPPTRMSLKKSASFRDDTFGNDNGDVELSNITRERRRSNLFANQGHRLSIRRSFAARKSLASLTEDNNADFRDEENVPVVPVAVEVFASGPNVNPGPIASAPAANPGPRGSQDGIRRRNGPDSDDEQDQGQDGNNPLHH